MISRHFDREKPAQLSEGIILNTAGYSWLLWPKPK
jgi:hypothetical protein